MSQKSTIILIIRMINNRFLRRTCFYAVIQEYRPDLHIFPH